MVSRNFFEELFRPTPRAGCRLQEANDELKSIDTRRASRTPGIRKRFLTSASIIYYNDFPLRCDSVRWFWMRCHLPISMFLPEDIAPKIHRTKSHVSVFLKRGGNMQLHVSVMFNMHKKWSGSVVYAATETRVSRLNMFLPRFRLRILAISSCDSTTITHF